MPVQVNPNNSVKHDKTVYRAGQVIQDLEDAEKVELVKLGVVTDLDAGAAANEQTAPPPPPPAAPEDEQLERGQVDDQVKAAVNQDLVDNDRLAATPGELIVNNRPSGIPVPPPAAPEQPTASQIAQDLEIA